MSELEAIGATLSNIGEQLNNVEERAAAIDEAVGAAEKTKLYADHSVDKERLINLFQHARSPKRLTFDEVADVLSLKEGLTPEQKRDIIKVLELMVQEDPQKGPLQIARDFMSKHKKKIASAVVVAFVGLAAYLYCTYFATPGLPKVLPGEPSYSFSHPATHIFRFAFADIGSVP